MNTLKKSILIAATILVAAIAIGAGTRDPGRPFEVPAEKWISVSDKAGFVVTSTPESSVVTAELYLKTDGAWSRVRIENSASALPLIQR